MILIKNFLAFVLTLFLCSCIFDRGEIIVEQTIKPIGGLNLIIANVEVINHQIIITGTGLNKVTAFQIKDGSSTINLQIESKSDTSIVANVLANTSFVVGSVLDFILSNAEAASSFQVTFINSNNSITAPMLSAMGATSGQVMVYDGSNWVATKIPLSGIGAAVGTNTLENLNFSQAWNWSTATTESLMTLTANSMTTGNILSLTSSSAALNSTKGLLNVTNTSASTTGVLARFQANSAAASGLLILANGKIGIGVLNPVKTFELDGTSYFSDTSSLASGTYDLFKGKSFLTIPNGASTTNTTMKAETWLFGQSAPAMTTYGFSSTVANQSMANTGKLIGIKSEVKLGAGTSPEMNGIVSHVEGYSGGGTVGSAKGLDITVLKGAYGDITTSYGVYIGTIEGASSYALYAADATTKSYLAGSLGIGTTNPAAKFQVGVNGDGSEALANNWAVFSDERLKRDFEIIPRPLEKLLSINGYYYYWDQGTDTSKKMGVKAQEVEKVFPEIVSHGKDGILSVSYNHLVAGVIEAFKEFYTMWNRDSSKKDQVIAKLVKENSEIKHRLNRIERMLSKN